MGMLLSWMKGCEPLISGQDVPPRYRVGRVASRRVLPRERFSPLGVERTCRSSGPTAEFDPGADMA
jgi:hypothetical protein